MVNDIKKLDLLMHEVLDSESNVLYNFYSDSASFGVAYTKKIRVENNLKSRPKKWVSIEESKLKSIYDKGYGCVYVLLEN